MALLAEKIVEEWLNRQGYFTMRSVRLGVNEIDLLAVKPGQDGSVSCRHIEVQASVRPVSYISKVPKAIQKNGKAANSVSRTKEELIEGVKEWVDKKFRCPKKIMLMQSLWHEEWSLELVLNEVKFSEEERLIASHGIKILKLTDIIHSLAVDKFPIKSAIGSDLIDLVNIGNKLSLTEK